MLNFIEKAIQKGNETVDDFTRELMMNEHFSSTLERIILTKGIVEKKIEKVLNSMNVATRGDVDELDDRIRKLNRELKRVQKQMDRMKKSAENNE